MEKLENNIQILGSKAIVHPKAIFAVRQFKKTDEFWFAARHLKGIDVAGVASGTYLTGGANVWVSLGAAFNYSASGINLRYLESGSDKYVRNNIRSDIGIGINTDFILVGIKFRYSSKSGAGDIHFFGQVASNSPINLSYTCLGIDVNGLFFVTCNSRKLSNQNEKITLNIPAESNKWHTIVAQWNYNLGIIRGVINGNWFSVPMFQTNTGVSSNVRVLNFNTLVASDIAKGLNDMDIKEMYMQAGSWLTQDQLIANYNYININS